MRESGLEMAGVGCERNVDFIGANRQELGFQYVKHVDFAGENEEMNWIPE